jgi:hypothetical protein
VPVNFSSLRPYQSLLVARSHSGTGLNAILNNVLNDIRTLLGLNPAGPRVQITRSHLRQDGHLWSRFIHYTDREPATWTTAPNVIDRINHLILVCRRGRHFAIYLSDPKCRELVVSRFGDATYHGLSNLEPVDPNALNAAFVTGNPTTVWLSGAHRPTTLKPDSKILTGEDIRDCLHPLDDQSYYSNAIRTHSAGIGLTTVGISPLESRVWTGPSSSWDRFRGNVTTVLGRLGMGLPGVASPLPFLATRVTGLAAINGAFCIGLIPPGLLADVTLTPQDREELEEWAFNTIFTIAGTNAADVNGSIIHNGVTLGTYVFQIQVNAQGKVSLTVTGNSNGPATAQDHAAALRACRRRGWIKIWYQSGHVYCDNALYSMHYRDIPFVNGFRWVNFAGFDVSQEKPDPVDVNTVGTQQSLFCWVKQFWPNLDGTHALPSGWLACDDGAQELADFIHLDIVAAPPMLSLIHVKGADNNGPGRGISVSAYEIVVAQAIKNLRNLERDILAQGLVGGLTHKISDVIWNNNVVSTRPQMLVALGNVAANYNRQVVVIQPHVRQHVVNAARAAPNSPNAARLRQLDTLLHAADASCASLSATFMVVAAQ